MKCLICGKQIEKREGRCYVSYISKTGKYHAPSWHTKCGELNPAKEEELIKRFNDMDCFEKDRRP